MNLTEAFIELNKNNLQILNEYKITPEFNELSDEDKINFTKLMNKYYDSVKIKDEKKKKARLKEVGIALKEYKKKIKNKKGIEKLKKVLDNCKVGIDSTKSPNSEVKDVKDLPETIIWSAKSTNPNYPKSVKDIQKFGYIFTYSIRKSKWDISNEDFNPTKVNYITILTEHDFDRLSNDKQKDLMKKGCYQYDSRYSYSHETWTNIIIPIDVISKDTRVSNSSDWMDYPDESFGNFIYEFAKSGDMKIIPPEIEKIIGKKEFTNYNSTKQFISSGSDKFNIDEDFYIMKYHEDSHHTFSSYVDSYSRYSIMTNKEFEKYLTTIEPEQKEDILNGKYISFYHEGELGGGSFYTYNKLIRYDDFKKSSMIDYEDKKILYNKILKYYKEGKIDTLPEDLQKYVRRMVQKNIKELKIIHKKISCVYKYQKYEKPYNTLCALKPKMEQLIAKTVADTYKNNYEVKKACFVSDGSDSEDDDYYWLDLYYPEELDEYITDKLKDIKESGYRYDYDIYDKGSKIIKY